MNKTPQRVKSFHDYREAQREVTYLREDGATNINIRKRTSSHAAVGLTWDVYYTPKKVTFGVFGA